MCDAARALEVGGGAEFEIFRAYHEPSKLGAVAVDVIDEENVPLEDSEGKFKLQFFLFLS